MELNQYLIDVYYSDMDEMGIVHHSRYIIWMENARFQFARNVMNLTFDDMKDMGLELPVYGIQCNYLQPVKYPGQLIVTTYLKKTEESVLEFDYLMQQVSDGTKIAKGKTVNVFLREGKLLLKYPAEIRKILEEARGKYPQYFK